MDESHHDMIQSKGTNAIKPKHSNLFRKVYILHAALCGPRRLGCVTYVWPQTITYLTLPHVLPRKLIHLIHGYGELKIKWVGKMGRSLVETGSTIKFVRFDNWFKDDKIRKL